MSPWSKFNNVVPLLALTLLMTNHPEHARAVPQIRVFAQCGERRYNVRETGEYNKATILGAKIAGGTGLKWEVTVGGKVNVDLVASRVEEALLRIDSDR